MKKTTTIKSMLAATILALGGCAPVGDMVDPRCHGSNVISLRECFPDTLSLSQPNQRISFPGYLSEQELFTREFGGLQYVQFEFYQGNNRENIVNCSNNGSFTPEQQRAISMQTSSEQGITTTCRCSFRVSTTQVVETSPGFYSINIQKPINQICNGALLLPGTTIATTVKIANDHRPVIYTSDIYFQFTQ